MAQPPAHRIRRSSKPQGESVPRRRPKGPHRFEVPVGFGKLIVEVDNPRIKGYFTDEGFEIEEIEDEAHRLRRSGEYMLITDTIGDSLNALIKDCAQTFKQFGDNAVVYMEFGDSVKRLAIGKSARETELESRVAELEDENAQLKNQIGVARGDFKYDSDPELEQLAHELDKRGVLRFIPDGVYPGMPYVIDQEIGDTDILRYRPGYLKVLLRRGLIFAHKIGHQVVYPLRTVRDLIMRQHLNDAGELNPGDRRGSKPGTDWFRQPRSIASSDRRR